MEYLFLGTNDIYYDAVDKCIDNIEDNDPKDGGHAVLVYKDQPLDDHGLGKDNNKVKKN